MFIRKAGPRDRGEIRRIARDCDVDYDDMERDDFLVADESGRLAGIVGLKRHPGGLELVALGVDPARRKSGVGGRLVAALLHGLRQDVYLATVIPDYFERLGFERVAGFPAGMAKDPDWCAGCPRELCTVMLRRPA